MLSYPLPEPSSVVSHPFRMRDDHTSSASDPPLSLLPLLPLLQVNTNRSPKAGSRTRSRRSPARPPRRVRTCGCGCACASGTTWRRTC